MSGALTDPAIADMPGIIKRARVDEVRTIGHYNGCRSDELRDIGSALEAQDESNITLQIN